MRLIFDTSVYSVNAVKKAAYRFLDRMATDIRSEGTTLICEVIFPPNLDEVRRTSIIADFRKEVLDQDLRENLAKETTAVRNAILAVAFAPISTSRE